MAAARAAPRSGGRKALTHTLLLHSFQATTWAQVSGEGTVALLSDATSSKAREKSNNKQGAVWATLQLSHCPKCIVSGRYDVAADSVLPLLRSLIRSGRSHTHTQCVFQVMCVPSAAWYENHQRFSGRCVFSTIEVSFFFFYYFDLFACFCSGFSVRAVLTFVNVRRESARGGPASVLAPKLPVYLNITREREIAKVPFTCNLKSCFVVREPISWAGIVSTPPMEYCYKYFIIALLDLYAY